ncbi:uncharacterized protein LOC133821725 [Humulus lupulus]|uniref:uncharacterized protein LOC133821725 n=1 Tax=Humulus lupulus TaxID=3486 RepID=UPI002B407A79|nr:uncharacterized protein LOC133821725 [Humulus lupulus]
MAGRGRKCNTVTKKSTATPAKGAATQKKGPTSSDVGKKSKSMDELLGIEAAEFSDDPEELILDSQETEKSELGGEDPVQKVDPEADQGTRTVRINEADIEDEVNFWNSSVVCWVLGANPPIQVMEGFFRRVWKNLGVDKVGLLKHGLYIVRFTSMESRDNVLARGYQFFDKKPLMIKAWDLNVCFLKEDIRFVPVWLPVHNLDLKYWGTHSLFKIINQLGQPIREDTTTKNRDRLQFSRVLVEVKVSQTFPSFIQFVNEKDEEVRLEIHYEWKPSVCSLCKSMGHEDSECRKHKQSKIPEKTAPVWQPKSLDVSPEHGDLDGQKSNAKENSVVAQVKSNTVTEGFQPASKISQVYSMPDLSVKIGNSFDMLKDNVEALKFGQILCDMSTNTVGGGVPPVVGLVCLLETKLKGPRLGHMYMSLFQGWCITSNLAAHSGGRIVLTWRHESFVLSVLDCTAQSIHCFLQPKRSTGFHITFVYAFNSSIERRQLWDCLKIYKGNISGAWVMMGDFNATLNGDERISVRGHKVGCYDFKSCLEFCEVRVIKCSGNFFTWNNKKNGDERIYAKLDRVLANSDWVSSYPTAEAVFLPEGDFDHSPILLSVFQEVAGGKKPFRYFDMWSTAPSYRERVINSWSQMVYGTPMFTVVQKLKCLKFIFKEMNREHFGDLPAQVVCSKLHMLDLQGALQLDPLNIRLINEEVAARTSFRKCQDSYLAFLKQKAKINWLKEGDDNTSLFHQSLKQRRSTNTVFAVQDMHGQWVDTKDGVSKAFLSFYQKLLGSRLHNRRKVSQSIVNLGPLVSSEQQQQLLLDFTYEDVKRAIFSIPNHKAPGPDGYGSGFYKTNWEIVGEEVSRVVISFLHSGHLLKEINNTTITLIPKTQCPSSVNDFRPISCCNVLYKAAAKLIGERLRCILPDLIAQNQGGFIHGRLIAHNIMIFQDLVRHYGRKTKHPSCMFKVDLRKAYDTVDWDFLQEMLLALNFPAKFVSLIMTCVRTPRYSLLLGGSIHGFFEAKRGLRQGDPLSPLLFVICMEYLSRILAKVSCKHDFHFHHRCTDLKLTHLCFADDVILFCRGDIISILRLLQGFKRFSVSSDLQANETKSTFYCHGMTEEDAMRIHLASGFSKSQLPFRYLGIPIYSKHLSMADCSVLAEKMVHKIQIWSSQHLSLAGILTLVNAILLSIQTYWAQVMILLRALLEKIVQICRNFLWHGSAEFLGPGSVAWDTICKRRIDGGLGVKDIFLWNLAAMGKHVWHISMNKESLWVKWIHVVYLEGLEWWDYSATADSSWYWRQVVRVKDLIKSFLSKNSFEQSHFSIADLYNVLNHKQQTRFCYDAIWLRGIFPKHRFFMWPYLFRRLKTKDRLQKFGLGIDSLCSICGLKEESHNHLFFDCWFSSHCVQTILFWLSLKTRHCSVEGIYKWIKRSKLSRFRKLVYWSILASLVYHIWKVRNLAYWEGLVWSVQHTIYLTKKIVYNRIFSSCLAGVKAVDLDWFLSLFENVTLL